MEKECKWQWNFNLGAKNLIDTCVLAIPDFFSGSEPVGRDGFFGLVLGAWQSQYPYGFEILWKEESPHSMSLYRHVFSVQSSSSCIGLSDTPGKEHLLGIQGHYISLSKIQSKFNFLLFYKLG